jgi:UDP-2-acetamido-2,6-beta-L-arabino-hexul-4-ose reductase
MRIGITGIDGFLGWHLRCRLLPESVEIKGAVESTFRDPEALAAFVAGCDVVVHLAAMNRGEPSEVEATNVALAEKLVAALEARSSKAHVLFSSSTHIHGDSGYGRSKKKAGECLDRWARTRGGRFTNLVLPHLFGEGGRPFYNSGCATFCHQLARGEASEVNPAGRLELIHAQRVSDLILRCIREETEGDLRVEGTPLAVDELYGRLRAISESYRAGIIPSLEDPLELELFNTYRSYLFPQAYPVGVTLHSDPRGWLFESVKTRNGGQSFLSLTHPGITRGNHYHRAKFERFMVIQGEAEIRIRRLFDDRIHTFPVSGRTPCFVDMPTFHTHAIQNTGGEELITMFWSHEIFDPARPDTYARTVEGAEDPCVPAPQG